jgi:hypothetical protein
LAIDSSGNLYESDPTGVFEFAAGTGAVTEIVSGANFGNGLAIDSAGDIFVTEPTLSGGSIAEITPGATSAKIVAALAVIPEDLAYDPGTGNLYFTYENIGGTTGGVDVLASGASAPNSPPFATLGLPPSGLAIATPEPGSLMLLLAGLLCLSRLNRRVVHQ